MGTKPVRLTAAAALIVLAACSGDEPTTAPSFAKGSGGSTALSVAPSAVEFSVPPAGSEVVTVSVQYVTTVTSATSNASCATVSPTSVPTRKPKSSSSYIATFTISAVGVGTCTITLTDKSNKSATVQVTIGPPLPDRIVYASDADGGSELWIMDLDGQNKTRLTPGPSDLSPVLSPDGRRILFTHKISDNVWAPSLIKVDGSNLTTIPLAGSTGNPFFSPNGGQITYGRLVDGENQLFKADVSGANEVQLTLPDAGQSDRGFPTWGGSSGGRIAYDVDNPRSIWIMNADGTGQTMVTDDAVDHWFHSGTFATISPDGTRIAFDCSPEIHTFEICIINADGTGGKVRLTATDGENRRPRWTRDGRIIFTSSRDGNKEVYIMNADGTGQTNLTNTPSTNEGTVFPF